MPVSQRQGKPQRIRYLPNFLPWTGYAVTGCLHHSTPWMALFPFTGAGDDEILSVEGGAVISFTFMGNHQIKENKKSPIDDMYEKIVTSCINGGRLEDAFIY